MNLMDSILGGKNGGAITQIAAKLGLPEEVATKAAGALAPALSRGLQRNAAKPGGLDPGAHVRVVVSQQQPDHAKAPFGMEMCSVVAPGRVETDSQPPSS